MALTASQIATYGPTIATHIRGSADMTGQTEDTIAALFAAAAAPYFFVYRTNVPVQELFNAIDWAKLTPADAPDGTQTWANRSLACQGKQFNLQTLVVGQSQIDATKGNIRAALQDALTNVPSGASGATQSAGWVPVRDMVLARKGNRLEKLLATTTAQQDGSTAAKAATMQVEGSLSAQNVSDILARF